MLIYLYSVTLPPGNVYREIIKEALKALFIKMFMTVLLMIIKFTNNSTNSGND